MRAPRRIGLAVVALGLLLAGCSAEVSTSATSAAPPSGSGASPSLPSAGAAPAGAAPAGASSETPTLEPMPVRGVCRAMTYAEAVAPTSDAAEAPCERRHTAETYAVGQLKTVVDGHLLAVDAARVQQQVATACPQRLARFAGGSEDDLRLSMLRSVWFTPTVQQSDVGANWYRCDAIVVSREASLAPVGSTLANVLDTAAGRERFGICATAAPGSPGFSQVLCRAPHTWRAIRTVSLTAGLTAGPYPGVKVVRAAGQEVCDDAARGLADDALDYQWGYEWPTSQQWASGQSYGRCWAPDAPSG